VIDVLSVLKISRCTLTLKPAMLTKTASNRRQNF